MKLLSTLRDMAHRERHALCLSVCSTIVLFAGLHSAESGARENETTTLLIYPTQARAISFSHATHTDSPCSTCHGDVAKSTTASQSHAPTMQACASCHTQEGTSPPLHACASCHINYAPEVTTPVTSPAQWQAVSPAPLIPPRAQAHLIFSHATHADTPCASCHDTSSPDATMPSMASCTSCHDGKRADATCSTCHTRAQTSQLSAKSSTHPAPPSMLTRPTQAPPESHAHDWLDRHGIIALTESEDCMSCHTETSCASCHNARSGQPLAHHPPNYLLEHRLSARLAEQNCTDCHRQEASCVACHTRTLTAPATDTSPGPPPALDVHPPTWLDASSANNHGVMARRNINECASCHQEQDCISCHQGISPHPPEFAMDCARILKKNPISCGKCHTQSLEAICPIP